MTDEAFLTRVFARQATTKIYRQCFEIITAGMSQGKTKIHVEIDETVFQKDNLVAKALEYLESCHLAGPLYNLNIQDFEKQLRRIK